MLEREPTREDDGRISDRIADFEDLAERLEDKGGDTRFLRYAWTVSLLADRLPARRDARRAQVGAKISQISESRKAAQEWQRSLRSLLPGDDPMLQFARESSASLEGWESSLNTVYAGTFRRRSGHPVVSWRRYYFFGALWPYMEFVATSGGKKWSARSRFEWMGEWFSYDDKTIATNTEFIQQRLGANGLRFADIDGGRFQILGQKPMSQEQTYQMAREWWDRARMIKDIAALRCCISAADLFLVWRHRSEARDKREEPYLPATFRGFSKKDLLYAKCAWAFLAEAFRKRNPHLHVENLKVWELATRGV